MLHTDIHQGASVENSWKQVHNNKCFFFQTHVSPKIPWMPEVSVRASSACRRLAFAASPLNSVAPNEKKKTLWHPGYSNNWNRQSRKQKFTMTATRKRRINLSKMKIVKFLFQTAECDDFSFSTTPVLRSAKTWSEAKASPIKCFVSHRPTDPFFWKLSKTKIKITCKEASTLVYNTSTRSCLINTNHRYFVFVAFLDIWSLFWLRTKGPRHQAFVLSSQAFAGTQNSSWLLFIYFFCPTDRPTFTRGRAMGNETFYWDGLTVFTRISVALNNRLPRSA